MGDGQHLWAAADWVMMMRHLFVREEGERLVIGQGLPMAWLEAGSLEQPGTPSALAPERRRGGRTLRLGPTPTPWGPVTITVTPGAETVEVGWQGEWRGQAPMLDIRLSGCEPVSIGGADASSVEVNRIASLRQAASGGVSGASGVSGVSGVEVQ